MSSSGQLSKLVADIRVNVSRIEDYLTANDLPQTSFDLESPLAVQLSQPLEKAREDVLEALTSLHARLLGPVPYLMRLMSPAVNIFNSLHGIYRFDIARKLMLDEEISYDALARRCQLDTCDLRRLLRLAMSFHVFHERQDGLVTHTAMSRALVEIPGLHDWMGLVCEDMHPASIRSIDAMEKWPGSGDPAHTGFALAEGIDCGFYDILGRDPLRASRFAKGMMLNNSAPALHPVLLADNLPWTTADCPKSVIDIGGSHGTVGSEILRRYPQIQEYVVQDLSDISGDRNGQDDSADRITYQQYDYFTEQTVKGADIYLLRLVLHNWSDEKAIEILKNQVAAMEPHSRIVLNEICLPKPGILPYYQEQFLRGFDLAMKNVFNGKERDFDGWAALIARVDPRACIQQIRSPPGSLLSIIEVVMQS